MATGYTPEEKAEIEARAADEIKRLGAVTIETKMALMDMSAGVKGITASLTKGFGQLGSSALGLGKQLYEGEIGASVFNKSIGGVTDALGDLLSLIPYVGGALKTLIKGASEYTQAVNLQADALYKNYQEMSKMGATAADGMQGVYDNLKRMNYGTEELDKFVGIVRENSQTLASFGKTVGQGVNEIATVSQAIQQGDVGRQFRDMGISVDEINRGIVSYTKMQTLVGGRQKMSTDELIAASQNYIKEVDLLSKITGKNRQEQEQARESAMAEERYAAFKYELDQRAKMGDEAAAAQLKQVEGTQIMLDKMAPETRKGFLNILSGTLNTPEAQKLLLTMPEAAAVAGKETFTQAEFQQAALKDITANLSGAGTQLAKIGANNDTFLSIQEQMKLKAYLEAGTADEREEAAKKAQVVTDKATQNMTDIQDANRKSRDSLQDLVNAGIVPVTTGMKGLANATDKTIAAFTKMAENLGVPVKKRDEPGAAATAPARTPAGPPGAPPAPPAAQAPTTTPKPTTRALPAQPMAETGGGAATGGARQGSRGGPTAKPTAPATTGETPAATPAATPPAAAPAPTKPASVKPASVKPAAAPTAATLIAPNPAAGTETKKPTPTPPEESGPPTTATTGPTAQSDLSKILKFTARSGTQQAFEGLNVTFKDAVIAAATEYHKLTGSVLQINSAKRSPADQQRLWDESVAAGRTGIGPTGMPIAKPGRSPHERGEAVDIQNYQDPVAVSALNKFGLTQKVPKDPVHFQAKNGGIVPPLPGGANILAGEAGQAEAVVPLPDGKTIPVQITGNEEQIGMMAAQLDRLDQLVRIMQTQVGVSERLLKYAQ